MFGIGKDHWAQSRQLFEDQFEDSGGGYLYRRWLKGPPIPVTAAERQRFIDDYGRRLRYSTWGILGGLLLFTAVVVGWTVQSGADLLEMPMYFGIGGIALVSVAYIMWAGSAPARELSRRAVLGHARSKAEMRRLMLNRMTYGQLAGGAFAGVLLVFSVSGKYDIFAGWGRLWLVLGGALVVVSAIQAFRKWYFGKQEIDSWS